MWAAGAAKDHTWAPQCYKSVFSRSLSHEVKHLTSIGSQQLPQWCKRRLLKQWWPPRSCVPLKRNNTKSACAEMTSLVILKKTGSWESLTVVLILVNSISNFYLFRDPPPPLKDPLGAARQCCVTWSFLEHETRVRVKLKLWWVTAQLILREVRLSELVLSHSIGLFSSGTVLVQDNLWLLLFLLRK